MTIFVSLKLSQYRMKTEASLQNIRTMRVNMMAKQNPSLKRLNLLEITFKNCTGASGYWRGSAKGVINFAAALGLGEAMDQILKSPQRKAGSNYPAFLDEE